MTVSSVKANSWPYLWNNFSLFSCSIFLIRWPLLCRFYHYSSQYYATLHCFGSVRCVCGLNALQIKASKNKLSSTNAIAILYSHFSCLSLGNWIIISFSYPSLKDIYQWFQNKPATARVHWSLANLAARDLQAFLVFSKHPA